MSEEEIALQAGSESKEYPNSAANLLNFLSDYLAIFGAELEQLQVGDSLIKEDALITQLGQNNMSMTLAYIIQFGSDDVFDCNMECLWL